MEKKKAKKEKFSEKIVKYGVGSFFLAKEGIERVLSEVEKKGEEHCCKASELEQEVKSTVKKGIEGTKKAAMRVLKSAGIATRDDIDELKKDIGSRKKEG